MIFTVVVFLILADSAVEPFAVTCVDDRATGYGTFQSHNQKVVWNRRGIFMTHIRSRNEAYTAQEWRLSQKGSRVYFFKIRAR